MQNYLIKFYNYIHSHLDFLHHKLKYCFHKQKFKEYIEKNKFNLDIPNDDEDDDDDSDDIEILLKQELFYREKIKKLREKLLNKLDSKIKPENDVYLQGIDLTNQQIH